jgi:hypothetical protein
MLIGHLLKISLYSGLFLSSLILLFFGGNAVDYTSWYDLFFLAEKTFSADLPPKRLMFREVVWNTACGYVVGTGAAHVHDLSLGQILGLTLFLCAWVTYLVLFGVRFVERNRHGQYRKIETINFDNLKEEEMYSNPTFAVTSSRYSDSVLEE